MHIILIDSISILSLAGFIISQYIFFKKKAKKKLVCPRYSNCDSVIHSDYSKIFGIRVEALGMVYYFLSGISYTALFIIGVWSDTISVVLLGVSICAVFFSLYLVSMQAFVIKHWCAWCIGSAFISIGIFACSYLHYLSY